MSAATEAIERREFDRPGVVAALDRMTLDDLYALLGEPVRIQEAFGATGGRYWQPGKERPALADESPAAICAVTRCVLARPARWAEGPRKVAPEAPTKVDDEAQMGEPVSTAELLAEVIRSTAMHPEPCGWCGYPTAALLAALDWSNWRAQFVTSDLLIWKGADGSRYLRETELVGTYANPTWQAFAELPSDERRYRVDASVAASRA